MSNVKTLIGVRESQRRADIAKKAGIWVKKLSEETKTTAQMMQDITKSWEKVSSAKGLNDLSNVNFNH